MNFFQKLVNPSDGTVSSKTVAGLASIFTALVIALSNHFFNFPVNDSVFFGLLTFTSACFGLNAIISNKKLDMQKAPDVNVDNAETVNVVKGESTNVEPTQNTEEVVTDSDLEDNEIIG